MNILVTGAAGVMGRRLVLELLKHGHSVRCLVLPGDPLRAELAALKARVLDATSLQVYEGDLTQPSSLLELCAGIEMVYHLAAVILARDPSVFVRVNREGTQHLLLEAARSQVRHFVYVSSASVTYPQLTAYGRSKLEAEQLVTQQFGLHTTIIRPTLVYDDHGGQEFLLFRDYLRRYPLVPFIGDGKARKRPVHTDDIVDGLVALVGNERAYGKTYNFSGAEAVSMRDFARLILARDGLRRRFVHVPVWFCRLLASLAERTMKHPLLTHGMIASAINHADLDPASAVRELGYHPRAVSDGLARRGVVPNSQSFSTRDPVTLASRSPHEDSIS